MTEFAHMKSAPSKGRDTSATVKHHSYFVAPKCNGMVFFPYVLTVLPSAAISEGPDGLMCVSKPVAGRTLTSAPVSTRNYLTEILSHTKRRLSLRLVAKATIDDLTSTFPCHLQGCWQ